jgi:hypothetical protein
MIRQHDTRPCTPHGHSAYQGYDAIVGKLVSLSPTGRVYTCAWCDRRFLTADERRVHSCKPKGWAA